MPDQQKIIYTITDEAPALATASFLPIIKKFVSAAGITVETKDISLAARILALFPDRLEEDQVQSDDLNELGELVLDPGANIIKLPNISASVPQLKAAIAELQSQGFNIPNYPDNPQTEEDQHNKELYNTVKGSAVNPVLREGNSDRRAPQPVKQYARKNPHKMGAWSSDSRTHVATMDHGDFAHNEKSITTTHAMTVDIVFTDEHGVASTLKSDLELLEGEILDATFMSKDALVKFLDEQIADARDQDLLFSLHMKATMMKVSDPIIFGHAVKSFFKPVFDKYGSNLDRLGVNVNNGFGDLVKKLDQLPGDKAAEINSLIKKTLEERPDLAMVDSDRGITNLHVPSDVIIDASMPAMIRTSGQMWNKDGKQQDTKAVIPDSSYAGIYAATIDFCKKHGAFDPTTMGSVPNVGLMAQKAEEYGSHDKTFEITAAGTIQVIDKDGEVLLSHDVDAGDIWRACQTKDAPVRNWVKLAVDRARATGDPAIFWLDQDRAHDDELITKVNEYLQDHNTDGLDITIASPVDAIKRSLERIKEGKDTISVTGNVLRDYNTDLFPILELGTSAKMLSIVPLMNGGGLFETGAGGSAPKHVQQFEKENHLRWDSLGEFLALSESLEHLAHSFNNKKAHIISTALNKATELFLENGKSPSRKVNELDNRGSHFYLALYWAQELAQQKEDPELSTIFKKLSQQLQTKEDEINSQLIAVQGMPVQLNGYYHPDRKLKIDAMRPSSILNSIVG
ncbi:MAG: NADP-dependent isocitrate dehydrogenase [Nonlabens sp.]